MAYVPTNPDDEEAKRRAAAGTPPGSFGDTTPSSTPTHTNFVNVSDYVNKNPDASGALGDAAAGKLNAQRDDAAASLKDTQSRFNQDVQGGSTSLDQNTLTNAFADPTKFAADPNNVAKFTAMRDAAYKGPDSLQSTSYFAPTQDKITGLQNTATSVGNEAGRNALVQGLSAHPTTGKTALDQLLLQGSDAAAQKVQGAAAGFKGVEDEWQNFVNTTPGQVSAAKASTDQTRQTTQSGLNDATSAFMKQLDDQTAKATQDRDAFNLNYSNIDKAISGGGSNLTKEQLHAMGIDDAYPYITKLNSMNDSRGLGYYNAPVQLSNYETKPGSANTNVPTKESVATPEQYAREAALQQLSGRDLGLPDQQAAPYQANGSLPTLDYMGAFNQAGTSLQKLDSAWQPKVAGYSVDDVAQLNAIQGRQGVGTTNGSYYTDPTLGAAANGGYGVAQPPAGWNPSQPVPYPAPTSNPPSNLINPQWNPYTGQWEGAQLAPPGGGGDTSGGGRHTF